MITISMHPTSLFPSTPILPCSTGIHPPSRASYPPLRSIRPTKRLSRPPADLSGDDGWRNDDWRVHSVWGHSAANGSRKACPNGHFKQLNHSRMIILIGIEEMVWWLVGYDTWLTSCQAGICERLFGLVSCSGNKSRRYEK